MNKQQFLDELKQRLQQIPAEDRQEILRDQEEFIREAVQAGRNESEVVEKLGTPKDFAASVLAEYKFQKIQTAEGFLPKLKAVAGSLGAFLILAPFNFIVLFGAFLTLFIVFITVAAFEITFLAMGVGGLALFFSNMLAFDYSMSLGLSVVFGSLGLLGLGLMITYFCYYFLLFSYRLFMSYLAWNLTFIKKNRIQF